mgnify:CR=1 FL=1
METKLEVCIDNLAGLDACIKGNADRIELCSSLIHGGLTPEVNLMKHASHAEYPLPIASSLEAISSCNADDGKCLTLGR